MSNPTSFHLCHRSFSNDQFPATCPSTFLQALHEDEPFYKADEEDSGITIPIPIDYTARVKAASGNPVAVAMEYQALIENVMEHLIGCPIEMRQSDNVASKKSWTSRGEMTWYPMHLPPLSQDWVIQLQVPATLVSVIRTARHESAVHLTAGFQSSHGSRLHIQSSPCSVETQLLSL